jgi:hypothetical protein
MKKVKLVIVAIIVASITLLIAVNTTLVEGFFICIAGGCVISASKEAIYEEDKES